LYSSPNNITIKFRRKRLSGMQRPWGKWEFFSSEF
jgi:hypothetical protein